MQQPVVVCVHAKRILELTRIERGDVLVAVPYSVGRVNVGLAVQFVVLLQRRRELFRVRILLFLQFLEVAERALDLLRRCRIWRTLENGTTDNRTDHQGDAGDTNTNDGGVEARRRGAGPTRKTAATCACRFCHFFVGRPVTHEGERILGRKPLAGHIGTLARKAGPAGYWAAGGNLRTRRAAEATAVLATSPRATTGSAKRDMPVVVE